MKKILLIAMLIIVANNVKAHDFEVDGYYYDFVSIPDLTVVLTHKGEDNDYWEKISPSYSGDVTIPKTVEYLGKTFNVIGFKGSAFANCQIGTLTIPNTIRSIHTHSFVGANIQHLIIEDGETPLYWSSLSDGNVTESVYLGRELDDGFTTIVEYYDLGGEYFGGGSFKKITFSDKLTSLGGYCAGCYNLTEVTIPESVKSLDGTFKDCTNLKKISAPGVETLDLDALRRTQLENIDFPNLRYIGSAFGGCKNLKNVIVPEGVIYVGLGAFSECENLESLTLPGTVVEFGGITGCKSLKTISLCNPTPVTSGDYLNPIYFNTEMFLNTTVKVPAGSLEAYRNAEVWKGFFNIEEDANLVSNIFTVYFPNEEYRDYFDDNFTITLSDEVLPAFWGYRFAKNMGHTVTAIHPALVPLVISESFCKEMMGLSLKNVEVTIHQGKKQVYQNFGEMLFTHYGVSGPLMLSASSYIGKKVQDKELKLVIDLKPALSVEQLDQRVLRDFEENMNKQFKNAIGKLFPTKLIPIMLELSGIDPDKKVNLISKEERQQFVML